MFLLKTLDFLFILCLNISIKSLGYAATTIPERGEKMIIVCCQCKKVLGEKPPLEDKSITHTYCPACLAKVMEELKKLSKDKKEA